MRRRLLAGACALAMLAMPATADAAKRRTVFVNGDSLAVGTEPYLPGDLSGWRVQQSASISRHAPEGPPILRGYGRGLSRVIVMSLGTNDDPRQVDGFRKAITDTMAIAGSQRCVVWVNIVRPPVAGTSYAGYNRALREESRPRENLRVVNWVRLMREHPEWSGSDGVHVNATGYQARARTIAKSVKRCK
jgi:lysophospholipase L1-like esterase